MKPLKQRRNKRSTNWDGLDVLKKKKQIFSTKTQAHATPTFNAIPPTISLYLSSLTPQESFLSHRENENVEIVAMEANYNCVDSLHNSTDAHQPRYLYFYGSFFSCFTHQLHLHETSFFLHRANLLVCFFAMLTPKYKLGKVHKKTQRHPKTMTKISSHILTPKYQRIFSFPPSKKSSSIKTKRDFCHQHWFRSENHKKNLYEMSHGKKFHAATKKSTILA